MLQLVATRVCSPAVDRCYSCDHARRVDVGGWMRVSCALKGRDVRLLDACKHWQPVVLSRCSRVA